MAAQSALMEAIALVAAIPDVRWEHGDDLCDCTFQRIGSWTNPYIAKTLRVRMCCLWEALYAEHPEFVQRIDAYWDENEQSYKTEPAPWDSNVGDMPRALWHRQIAIQTGLTLDEVRAEYADQEPPKAAVKPRVTPPAYPSGKVI